METAALLLLVPVVSCPSLIPYQQYQHETLGGAMPACLLRLAALPPPLLLQLTYQWMPQILDVATQALGPVAFAVVALPFVASRTLAGL